MKKISSCGFVQEISWDGTEVYTRNAQTVANTPFNELLGTNLSGVNKVVVIFHNNYGSQEHSQTCSSISVTDFNIEIDSKDYFNINLRTHKEAYRILMDNFNIGGNDYNAGSHLAISDWLDRYKIYAVDLSRQEVFEAHPNVSQQIRIRGTLSATGALKVYLFKNKKTQIDFSNPEKTRTIH